METEDKRAFIDELHLAGVIGNTTVKVVNHYLDGKPMEDFPPVLVFEGEEHVMDGADNIKE